MRKNEGMGDNESAALTNRYPAADEWQAVDRYFASALVDEEAALVAHQRRTDGAGVSGPR